MLLDVDIAVWPQIAGCLMRYGEIGDLDCHHVSLWRSTERGAAHAWLGFAGMAGKNAVGPFPLHDVHQCPDLGLHVAKKIVMLAIHAIVVEICAQLLHFRNWQWHDFLVPWICARPAILPNAMGIELEGLQAFALQGI